MKLSKKELVTFAESITNALEEVATKIGAIEEIINGNKEVEDVVDEDEDEDVEIVDEDVDDDTINEDEEVEDDVEEDEEEPVEEEDATENFSARLEKVKNFLNM